MVGLIACQLQIPLKLGKTQESRENKCIKTKQHGKCQGQYVRNWNQYSKCMHVSIFLCYCVTVLKSLNYACKNLTYAYICMKVYNLAGMRQAHTRVGFAKASSKIHFLTQVEQQVTAADPSQGHNRWAGNVKDASAFLLHPSPFHIPAVQAACISFLAYGFPTWPPSSPLVFKWADFASQGIFFLMIKRMLLISSGYRSGMVIKSYNAQHSPSSPTKNSRPKCQQCPGPCSSHSPTMGFQFSSQSDFYFLKCKSGEFPGGPGVRTQCFHCCGLGSVPG